MTKSGTEPVRQRDEAVQPPLVTKTPVRGPDERAVLLSERSAVWDRRASPLPPIVEPDYEVGALGPMPSDWTADLVHCRLVCVAALARRLPRVKVPPTYRSFLGGLQPQDAVAGRHRPLTDEEATIFDWTMARLYLWSEIDRAVVMGVMAGHKLKQISAVTFGIAARHGGTPLKKSAVHKRYHRRTAMMADEWKAARVPVDAATRECWLNVASK